MEKYYTLMLIPDKEKKIKSVKIPSFVFKSLAFISACSILLVIILGYDYWKILQQVYENKHLSLENQQLRDQIQIFQMKMNNLIEDFDRINSIERKLRTISGVKNLEDNATKPYMDQDKPDGKNGIKRSPNSIKDLKNIELNINSLTNDVDYKKLKNLYTQKIANFFGIKQDYYWAKNWSQLIKQSFNLSHDFALFDFKFNRLKSFSSDLEMRINSLDQVLLDKQSFLRSTPTILPTNGWITSYYGQRFSPYSGVLKMHEGIDVGAPYGTTIFAPADGVVVYSGQKAGFGKFVQIDHGYGIETIYAHSKELLVKAGNKIKRRDPIARVGSTGHSTGPHLHYEVRVNGIAVDPLYFILEN
ncbi:peptidoglycan DD-metalloendopeptidase family protein [Bacteriovoracaceae bacterium]|nr:peptidoglycan DD-metalloendopeptidase family protein [Bacteriovoracaceae bacterium]